MTRLVRGVAPDWMLGAVGVPQRLRAATFAASKPTPAVQHARAYYDVGGVQGGRLLGLLGPTGVGKSWAMAALVNADLTERDAVALFERERQHRWVLCATLLRELRDFRTAAGAAERASTARLLVLDDLQVPDEDAARRLDEIFIRREQEGLPVVFTSNLTRKQLAAALSDRVLDRIRAWGDLREVPGQSLRRPPSETPADGPRDR